MACRFPAKTAGSATFRLSISDGGTLKKQITHLNTKEIGLEIIETERAA